MNKYLRNISVTLLTCMSTCFMAGNVFGQVDPIDKNGIAIDGYDLVSYFESQKPVRGNKSISTKIDNVTYFFSSKENQELFKADPKKYIPQYEGYCALAVSYGKKISIDPQTYKIIDNKLYLFFHGISGKSKVNSINIWNKNEPRLLKKADELWPDVKKSKYTLEDNL